MDNEDRNDNSRDRARRRGVVTVLAVLTLFIGSLGVSSPVSAHGAVTNDGIVMCERMFNSGTRMLTIGHQTISSATPNASVRFWVYEASSAGYVGRGWLGATQWFWSNAQGNKWLYDYSSRSWGQETKIFVAGNLTSTWGPVMHVQAEVSWADGHITTQWIGSSSC